MPSQRPMPSPHERGWAPQAAPDIRQNPPRVDRRGPAANTVVASGKPPSLTGKEGTPEAGHGDLSPPALGEPDARESARDDRERSGTAFKIIYMDGSWQILKFVKGYTIKDGWIEFCDAHGQLQSVRSDDVRRISRLSVEEPKFGNVPTKSENLGARPGSESTSESEQPGDAGGSGADSTEQAFSKTRDWWNSTPPPSGDPISTEDPSQASQ
jgi:hypothetical protein